VKEVLQENGGQLVKQAHWDLLGLLACQVNVVKLDYLDHQGL